MFLNWALGLRALGCDVMWLESVLPGFPDGDVHEYVIVYAKDPQTFKETRSRVPLDEKSERIYKNPNNDPRGRWRGIPMTAQGFRQNQMYA